MKQKTKLKIGCPKCGGPVGQESGFHACLNKRCGWHDTGLAQVGRYYEPHAAREGWISDNYCLYRGRYTKRVGGEGEL